MGGYYDGHSEEVSSVAPDQERQRQQEASPSSFSSMFDYTPIREQRVAGILADPANKESFALSYFKTIETIL